MVGGAGRPHRPPAARSPRTRRRALLPARVVAALALAAYAASAVALDGEATAAVGGGGGLPEGLAARLTALGATLNAAGNGGSGADPVRTIRLAGPAGDDAFVGGAGADPREAPYGSGPGLAGSRTRLAETEFEQGTVGFGYELVEGLNLLDVISQIELDVELDTELKKAAAAGTAEDGRKAGETVDEMIETMRAADRYSHCRCWGRVVASQVVRSVAPPRPRL